jgi:hypothetical protein
MKKPFLFNVILKVKDNNESVLTIRMSPFFWWLKKQFIKEDKK